MEKQKEVLRILLNHYTKIGTNGGIAKVIFDDEFENIAEKVVKLFAIPAVKKSLPDIDIDKAEELAMITDYAVFSDGDDINTADAGAFFLEGYLYAKRQLGNGF